MSGTSAGASNSASTNISTKNGHEISNKENPVCYNEIIWAEAKALTITVHDNGIRVIEQNSIRNQSNDMVIASVKGLSEDEIKYIAQPTVEAAKRKSSNNTIKITDKITLKLDKVGQTSAVTERRLSSVLNTALHRFVSRSASAKLFNEDDENMRSFTFQEQWGFDQTHVPNYPKPTWIVEIQKKRKNKGRLRS